MIKYYNQKVIVQKELMYCDECKTQIEEYGNNWFTISHSIGEFRDDCGETKIYHFCSWECLNKFIKKHKPQTTAHAELEMIK